MLATDDPLPGNDDPKPLPKACADHDYTACCGANLCWFDSCDDQQEIAETCDDGCAEGACFTTPEPQPEPGCEDFHHKACCGADALCWFDSCGNQHELIKDCPQGCIDLDKCLTGTLPAELPPPTFCQNHDYTDCCDDGKNVCWFDSCGNQQKIASTCDDGCNFGECAELPPTTVCKAHDYTACCADGGSVCWFDSCGNEQKIALLCLDGCQEGSCVKDEPVQPAEGPAKLEIINDLYDEWNASNDWGKWNAIIRVRVGPTESAVLNDSSNKYEKLHASEYGQAGNLPTISPEYNSTQSSKTFDAPSASYWVFIQCGYWEYQCNPFNYSDCTWTKRMTQVWGADGVTPAYKWATFKVDSHTSGKLQVKVSEFLPHGSWDNTY